MHLQPGHHTHNVHPLVELTIGDSLRVLRTFPDHHVDAVVCDPPYAIKAGTDPLTPFYATGATCEADACVGCAANHRAPGLTICTPCAENHQIDTFAAASMLGQQSANWHEKATHSRGYADNNNILFAQWVTLWARECLRVLKPGGHVVAFGGTKTWHRLATGLEDAGFEIRDSLAWVYGTGTPKSLDVSTAVAKHRVRQELNGRSSAPSTDQTNRTPQTPMPSPHQDPAAPWDGWGTAVKPAHEPIVLARKRPEGTVGANVNRYGTGALNIDGTRLEGERWPSNLYLDHHQATLLDAVAGQRASRFFWVAKPNPRERVTENGVSHPTVKPLQLMRELVRLVTPPGGVVLDPFAGSGTTAEAAVLEGMSCLAIEKDPAFMPLIRKRMARTMPPGSTKNDAQPVEDTGSTLF